MKVGWSWAGTTVNLPMTAFLRNVTRLSPPRYLRREPGNENTHTVISHILLDYQYYKVFLVP